MAFELKTVDELAEEEGKSVKATKAYLAKMGVREIGGYFDAGSLEAIKREPKLSNTGKKVKSNFTLAPTDGLGAMKHCIDMVNLDITRHMTRRTHYLTLRNGKGRRSTVKVYTTHLASTDEAVSRFTLTGFLNAGELATHYVFICYKGPLMWALSRKQLVALHQSVKAAPASSDLARIPKNKGSHPTGCMMLYLDPGIEKYVLTNAKQLGM